MANVETITVTLSNGIVDVFQVDDGYGAFYATSIETSGYGHRPDPEADMNWYQAADVVAATVS